MMESTQEDIQAFILDYIREQLPNPEISLDGNTDFVRESLLESFAILDLIMTLENRYAIKFQPRELADPGIRVIATLAQGVTDKIDTA